VMSAILVWKGPKLILQTIACSYFSCQPDGSSLTRKLSLTPSEWLPARTSSHHSSGDILRFLLTPTLAEALGNTEPIPRS